MGQVWPDLKQIAAQQNQARAQGLFCTSPSRLGVQITHPVSYVGLDSRAPPGPSTAPRRVSRLRLHWM